MYGLKGDMDGLKWENNGLKEYMEGLTKFLQERLPRDDKVFHENHNKDIVEYEL